jgi:hypothetical protein
VSEHLGDPLAHPHQVVVTHQDFPWQVQCQSPVDAAIGKHDAMTGANVAVTPARELVDLVQQQVVVFPSLLAWVSNAVSGTGAVRAGPALGTAGYAAALHLQHQQAQVGVGHKEIRLAIPGAPSAARLPGHAIKDVKVVVQRIQRVEGADLGRSTRVVPDSDGQRARVHCGHGASVSYGHPLALAS